MLRNSFATPKWRKSNTQQLKFTASVRVYCFAWRAMSRCYLTIRPSDIWWAELIFCSQFWARKSV